MSTYRVIPSIEQLLRRETVRRLETRYGHEAIVNALRDETESLRTELKIGSIQLEDSTACASLIENRIEPRLQVLLSPTLQPVINAAGVIIHTNLGRAPLARAAIQQIEAVAGYSNLEYDLDQGIRGTRAVHATSILRRLTGAENAAVVNNNAGAILLTLTALATGREVIISRGELVEIGGGFRVPDVLRQSGAQLREIGTTNRTRSEDYAAAISERTALILRVHPSNFRVDGFTERPTLDGVTAIGRRFNIPVVEDLGSGSLLDQVDYSDNMKHLSNEPTVKGSLDAGVTVCCFSGDKLLGGPQAGIIVGRSEEIDTIQGHPLMRALRVDKIVYAALEATLLQYATGHAIATIPVLGMIDASLTSLEKRAKNVMSLLDRITALHLQIDDGETAIGGGTTPGITLPTRLLVVTLEGHRPEDIQTKLRKSSPPVIARIDRRRVVLDLRTVQPDQDELLVAALAQLPPTSPND